jgi:Bacterial regulatory proteins, luxR family
VGQSYTSKEIARMLGLSPSTVDNHIRAAMERLNVTDRAQAARMSRAAQDAHFGESSVNMPISSRSVFRLPPLGGVPNDISPRRRIWHVIQIALLGVMAMAATVVTIAGLVKLFGDR